MNQVTAIGTNVEVDTVVFPFLGSEIGGSHIAAFTLGEALMQHFAKTCVVIATENSLIGQEAERRGFKVVSSGERPINRNNPLYDVTQVWSRLNRLRCYGPNALVHCNDIGTLQSWGVAARLLRLPLVYHHHALNRMVLLNRLVLRLADAVICVSDPVRRSIDSCALRRVSTVLNPFSLPSFVDRTAARAWLIEQYGFEDDALIIGFVGNFWHRKRPYFFLDICRSILANAPKARFVVFGRAGEISEGQLLDYARQIGLSERTTFAGFQLPAENNIAALDLLMLPAIREPFGRTLVESLLLAVPYVATADAGHCEIASRWGGGILVDRAATPEQFAEQALDTAARAGSIVLSSERRRAIADELSAEGHARKVIAIYREAMQRK